MASRFLALWVVILLLAPLAAADWKEPPDKKFTEDQLKIYLDTEQDWLDATSQMMQQIANSKTGVGATAAVENIDEKYQACLDKHHISKAEFEWIGQRASEAWGALTVFDQGFKAMQDQIDSQTTETNAKLAEAQKRLATYQEAQKNGTRVMTQDDRDAAIKSAKDQQQSALDEAKQHGDDATAAETDAKQHDADAKADDDLAANPPAEVSSDDRPGYIDGKKTDAQSARDAAKDCRSREDDAKKAQADALAVAAAAEQRTTHPEIPQTDDDKAAVKSEDDSAVAAAQSDIDDCHKQQAQIAETEKQMQDTSAQMFKDVPPENVAIMRKYADRYKEQFNRALAGGTTQPSH